MSIRDILEMRGLAVFVVFYGLLPDAVLISKGMMIYIRGRAIVFEGFRAAVNVAKIGNPAVAQAVPILIDIVII